MKLLNIGLTIGGAALAALLVVTLVSSCATTCSHKAEVPCDWYAEYYPECIKACQAAREWGEVCGYPSPIADCIDVMWDYGIPPIMCAAAAGCYEALTKTMECGDRDIAKRLEEGWMPPLWQDGCPVEVGGE